MSDQFSGKLNQLANLVPEGLIVDSGWLSSNGYYNSLRSRYVNSGWLAHLAHGVYGRRRNTLDWVQVVVSLQTILEYPLLVGGRSALELQGFGHYASELKVVHLYSQRPPPGWLDDLPIAVRFEVHNGARLFLAPIKRRHEVLEWERVAQDGALVEPALESIGNLKLGNQPWPVAASIPERAILEAIDELPRHESFHQLDMVMEGLTTLRPRRLQALLEACRSIKVKRLFFLLADRHGHAWLTRIDRDAISLGKGKRSLIPGGKLDPKYQITVPEDF
jgi:hypothetical protein